MGVSPIRSRAIFQPISGGPAFRPQLLAARLPPQTQLRHRMPAVTRRADNPHREVWHGHLRGRAGRLNRPARRRPVGVAQWQWSCGFYPGCDPGEHINGVAADFFTARREFEIAWRELSAVKIEADYQAWRDDRDMKADIRAKHARGERLDGEIPNSMMRCPCGIRFDSHVLAENLIHLPHINTARAERRKS